eukprot:jgi/Tetstr1/466813/TSEL_011283.t1
MVASPFGKRGDQPAARKLCNCKNSRCLKLYCECFASGRFCDNCNCSKCANNEQNSTERAAAVQQILDRNPHAFRPKVADGSSVKHSKGCNCKKSGCLKKYCECFQAAIFCADNCKCNDCKNYEGSEARANAIHQLELKDQGLPSASTTPARASSGTPSKRQRTSNATALGASQHPLSPIPERATKRADDTEAKPPGVLQGVIKPGAIEELCKLLVLSANEVAASANLHGTSNRAPGFSGTSRVAARCYWEVGGNHASLEAAQSRAAADGTDDRAAEAALYCTESTEELMLEREDAGEAPGNSTAAAEQALLYEKQEARVLKEFLETLQQVAALGKDRLEKRQVLPPRFLFPDASPGQAAGSSGQAQRGRGHTSVAVPVAHGTVAQQHPLMADLQAVRPGGIPVLSQGNAASMHFQPVAPLAPAAPGALTNAPPPGVTALQVMHNGVAMVIPASSATWVTMPAGSAPLQQPVTLSQVPAVVGGSPLPNQNPTDAGAVPSAIVRSDNTSTVAVKEETS